MLINRQFSLVTKRYSSALRQKGFSLLELIAAVLICGVLAVLLFPLLTRSKNQAKVAGCIVNLRKMGAGIQAYAMENYGKLPPYSVDGGSGKSMWSAQISPYLEVPLETGKQAGASYLRCPAAHPSVEVETYTYGANYTSDKSPPVITYPPEVSSSYPGSARIWDLRARTVIVLDATRFNYVLSPRFYPESAKENSPYNYAAFLRHPGKRINVLYSDGSAGTVSISDWGRNLDNMAGE